jgi:hypothetical protein
MPSEDRSCDSPSATNHAGPTGRRLSDLLRGVAGEETRDRISIGDLVVAMQDRALAALLFIFAFPNCLPTPPGTSSLLGLPLIFLAAQLALGRRPWLPKVIAARSMSRRDFATLIDKANPWLMRAERLLRPRLGLLSRPPVEYIVGVTCFVLAIILFLPIPLGNILPAMAICVFSLGILERDGLWIATGFLLSGVSGVVVWGVVWALAKTAIFIVLSAFN